MASIVCRPNGHKWVQFKGLNGKRQTIRLGKATKQYAADFRLRVECLLSARAMGHPPDVPMSRWVATLSPTLHDRLSAAGLIQGRVARTLSELIDSLKASVDVKPSTTENIAVACSNLIEHFGPNRPIAEITQADAKEFRTWLGRYGGKDAGPLAAATISRRCRRAKQVFTYAVEKGWLPDSPFSGLRGFSEVNRSKDFWVDVSIIQRVLDEIPDIEFRALVVLVRFGGLRCPSEVLSMRWDQVNWEYETILIEAPKTAHHADGGIRTLPLFPEIKEAFQPLWEAADDGQPLLFAHHQGTGAALTNKLRRACWSAGIPLWPRPWQNMRATRETELLSTEPIHKVAHWLGHSPGVALKHYAQIVKDQDVNVKLRKSVLHLGPKPGRVKQKPKHRRAPQGYAP